MTLDAQRMGQALRAELHATDLADYLVRRGVPFRTAHHTVGELVRAAEGADKGLGDLTLEEMTTVHPAFEEDVFAVFDPVASIESRGVRGGTSSAALQAQLEALAGALRRA